MMLRLFRRSNRSLYLEACRRKADGAPIGPTPHQARLQAAGDLDALFWGDFLVEQVHSTNAYSTAYRARHLPSGRVLLLRCYAEEFCLDAEAYHSLTQALSEIDSPLVTIPSHVFEHRGRLCVAREWIDGESLASIVSRTKSLSPRFAVEFCLSVLRTISGMSQVKLKGLRPSQVIVDNQGRAHLVDLDETELLIFRRKTPLKATGASPFSGLDRSFFTAEAAEGRVSGNTHSTLYSVGRLLGYMIAGDWRPSAQQKGLKSCGMDALESIGEWLCETRESTQASIDQAIAKVQLYQPTASDAKLLNRFSIQTEPAHPPQPRIMTTSLTRVAMFVTFVLSTGIGTVYFASNPETKDSERSLSEPARPIESLEEFQIP